MKPFNLEEALAGKPLVTRDGKPARLICSNLAGTYPLAVAGFFNEDEPEEEEVERFTNEGNYYEHSGKSKYDLFMAITKKSCWVYLCKLPDNDNVCSSIAFDSEKDAMDCYKRVSQTFIDGAYELVKICKLDYEYN